MTKRAVSPEKFNVTRGSVYGALGYKDADEMLVKAELVSKIADIIASKRLTQTEAAKLLGLTQPKLSGLLRGSFRGISERRLIQCLTSLGRDVQIVVKEPARAKAAGKVSVVFA